MKVIYAREEMPEIISKSIFLAGPSPRNRNEIQSWRPEAIKILEAQGFDGAVFIPEPREATDDYVYEEQVEWEEKFLKAADCIVFWIPRDLKPDTKQACKMAGLTTNVEWGVWCDSGKVVLGCPNEAEKVQYIKYYANKYRVPLAETLSETLSNAIDYLGDGAPRSGGERHVPLFIWRTESFQSWYKQLKKAGNRLDYADLLYSFRPQHKQFVFLWILKVDVYIAAEDRYKTNEFVLARPDISSVVMYSCPNPQGDGLVDYEVVLIKEFRSPACTEDGFIRELPGGSSHKQGEAPEITAAEEVCEETGFSLDPKRLQYKGAQQLVGTLSSHKSHLYSVELSKEEMNYFKYQKDIVHGNIEDSERTFVEVHNVLDLLNNKNIDWSTLGQILSVLAT